MNDDVSLWLDLEEGEISQEEFDKKYLESKNIEDYEPDENLMEIRWKYEDLENQYKNKINEARELILSSIEDIIKMSIEVGGTEFARDELFLFSHNALESFAFTAEDRQNLINKYDLKYKK